MTTLVLAERPFRDLRSRALLLDLPARLGESLLLATVAPNAPPGFTAVPPDADLAALGVTRIVLAGIFQERRVFEGALATVAKGLAAGARLEVRHLSVERAAARPRPPPGAEVLDAAPWLEVRDHHTANALLCWRVAPMIRIDPYPERAITPDPALLPLLPGGPLLGLAILGGPEAREAWMARLGELRALLAPARFWPVLPLPCEPVDGVSDDYPGSCAFRDAVLPDSPLLLPDLARSVWRRREFTPGRMKALVARCRVVVTNQDLPAAFAVACGVPVLGLALGADRRIISCLSQLANELPAGSSLLYPPRAPASPAISSALA